MRLTIIPEDGFVSVNNYSKYYPLNLSGCNIPINVHALQWYDTRGWIEFRDDPFVPKLPNEDINVLPDWANSCVEVWNSWSLPETQKPEGE